jgi:hypothetical protein
MTVNEWWHDRPEERYWMIAPSRGVVGDALSAPKAASDRRFEWSHELVGFTEPGDTLFVWDRTLSVPGIAAWGPVYFPFIGAAETLAPAPAYLSKVPRDLVALLSSRFGFEFAL